MVAGGETEQAPKPQLKPKPKLYIALKLHTKSETVSLKMEAATVKEPVPQGGGFKIGDVLNVKLKKSGTGGRGGAGPGEKKMAGQPDLPLSQDSN